MQLQRPELYGDVLRKLTVPHFIITETRYAPGTHLPAHVHDRCYLSVVLQGSYKEIHNRNCDDCSTGSLIFHPRNEEHINNFDSFESRCLNLHFTFDESLVDVDFTRRKHKKSRSAAVAMFRIHRELCDPDPISKLIVDGLAFELLGETLRSDRDDRRIPGWLKQVEDFIHSSFQKELTIATLAHAAGVHPVHLSRSFRKFYRCTAGEYLRAVRLDFGSRMLRTTDMELAEVALQSGFSDQSAFAKCFKRFTGYTPGQFRKIFRSR